MTIAHVDGGLGRQMFGYAAARRVALRHGTAVHIDPRNYVHHDKHEMALQHFALDAVFMTPAEADAASGPYGTGKPVVRAQTTHVDRAVLDAASGDVLVAGSFASEDYFRDVEDELRREFTRVSEPSPYAQEVHAHLADLRSRGFSPVAVHVRRGDRLTDPDLGAVYGVCTDEYYATATALVERLVEDPWFVIFSDDPGGLEEQWAGERRTVTSPPTDTPVVDDMLLMAACDHQIIANSAYSWWGAWLGRSADQVVIGPRPFLADRRYNSEDVLPREWISLGSIPRPRL